MIWRLSYRADPIAVPIADRHYNRQSIGSPQFVPPGRCVVLVTESADALWVTSWPFAEYTHHAWPGAWINSCFRRESECHELASEIIRQAVAATLAFWEPPSLGMVTFIDTTKVRKKRDYGRCYRKAGFRPVGYTKGGLLALQLLPADMPPAESPLGFTPSLFDSCIGLDTAAPLSAGNSSRKPPQET